MSEALGRGASMVKMSEPLGPLQWFFVIFSGPRTEEGEGGSALSFYHPLRWRPGGGLRRFNWHVREYHIIHNEAGISNLVGA